MGYNGDLYPTAGAAAVMTTSGDLVKYTTERARLPIGSANQLLQVKSNLPSWETIPLSDTVLTTAGDILYENNTPELARLPVGSDADVLTLASGLPSWATPAGGGGSMEYKETYTLASSTTSFTWTFGSAITLADVAKVRVVVNMEKASTAATIFLKYNGVGTSTYNNAVVVMNSSGTIGGYYNSARFYGWDLFEVNNTNEVTGTFDIFKNVVTGKMQMTKELSGEGGYCGGSGFNTGTGAAMPATLTSLYFESNSGNINSGSKFDLYTVNR